MTLSDPVSNMLTIIRNAIMRGLMVVSFPHSDFKWRICQKFLEQGFLNNCQIKDRRIFAEIGYNGKRCRFQQIEKVSTPSRRVHLKVGEIKKFCRQGTYLISTSYGLLTNWESLQQKKGGKVILRIS